MKFETLEDASGIAAAFVAVSTTPFFVASLICVWKQRQQLYFKMRDSTLVLIHIAVLGIMTVLCSPITMIEQHVLLKVMSNSTFLIINKAGIIVTNAMIYAIVNGLLARILMYFVRIYNTQDASKQIRISIDNSNVKNDTDQVTTTKNSKHEIPGMKAKTETKTNTTDQYSIASVSNISISRINRRVCGCVLAAWVIESIVSAIFSLDDSVFLAADLNIPISMNENERRDIRTWIRCIIFVIYALIIAIVIKIDANKDKTLIHFKDNWHIRHEVKIYGKILLYLGVGIMVRTIIIILFPKVTTIIEALLYLFNVVCALVGTYIASFWVIKINTLKKLSIDNANTYKLTKLTYLQILICCNCIDNKSLKLSNTIDDVSCQPCDSASNSNSNSNCNINQSNYVSSLRNVNNNVSDSDKHCKTLVCIKQNCKVIETANGVGIGNEPKLTMTDGSTVSRMSQFFDESFDQENNYVNVCREFELFINHCSRELSVENILFWIHWVQLLDILICNNIIDKNNQNHINSGYKNYTCKHYLCDTILIHSLKQDFKTSNNNNNMSDDSNSQDNIHCQALQRFYCKLFKHFIEARKAPFEMNISGETRQSLTDWYGKLANNDACLTKDMFVNQIWKLLKLTAIDIYLLVEASFSRYQMKQQMK